MRIVFLGSPEEVISPLDLLLKSRGSGIELVGVVSQPAKPQGRGRVPEDPAVAKFAKVNAIPTFQPQRASDPEFLDQFKALEPDVAVTAAYGQILTDAFLAIPKRATINIHPSLLPKYRGATPVQSAIAAGESTTGVSILFTVKMLDAGPIILQRPFTIGSNERSCQLMPRLFKESGSMLLEAIDMLKSSDFIGIPQNENKVSHCRKINKTDGNINWEHEAEEIFNHFRAYDPWPGSHTFFGGRRVVVNDMALDSDAITSLEPGHFVFDKKNHCLVVGTGSGPLQITNIKPAGGGVINAAAFWNGLKDRSHPVFTSHGA